MITLADYWAGRDVKYSLELTDTIIGNAMTLLARTNLLLSSFREATGDTEQRKVTSGWRPAAVNAATPNAAVKSKHMTGEAVDIADPEGDFDQWCLDNAARLENIGLWQEHPSATRGWTHLQCVPPKSGRRAFYP